MELASYLMMLILILQCADTEMVHLLVAITLVLLHVDSHSDLLWLHLVQGMKGVGYIHD